jgi:hypothetical protein
MLVLVTLTAIGLISLLQYNDSDAEYRDVFGRFDDDYDLGTAIETPQPQLGLYFFDSFEREQHGDVTIETLNQTTVGRQCQTLDACDNKLDLGNVKETPANKNLNLHIQNVALTRETGPNGTAYMVTVSAFTATGEQKVVIPADASAQTTPAKSGDSVAALKSRRSLRGLFRMKGKSA